MDMNYASRARRARIKPVTHFLPECTWPGCDKPPTEDVTVLLRAPYQAHLCAEHYRRVMSSLTVARMTPAQATRQKAWEDWGSAQSGLPTIMARTVKAKGVDFRTAAMALRARFRKLIPELPK
jgi:hypothetical protein